MWDELYSKLRYGIDQKRICHEFRVESMEGRSWCYSIFPSYNKHVKEWAPNHVGCTMKGSVLVWELPPKNL